METKAIAISSYRLNAFPSLRHRIDAPDIAEVRGLTVRGINSRRGAARRSPRDQAC